MRITLVAPRIGALETSVGPARAPRRLNQYALMTRIAHAAIAVPGGRDDINGLRATDGACPPKRRRREGGSSATARRDQRRTAAVAQSHPHARWSARAPDTAGRWNWRIAFVRGKHAAIDADAAGSAAPVQPFDGLAGSFRVSATNKRAPDFRARGRLEYVGGHYLRFAGTGEYFLKVGPDSPETLLAYADFDDTKTMKAAVPVHAYEPHMKDWANGDPTWKDGKGKSLVGVVNYLSSKGANSLSFLTYNAGGDGDNVWPFVSRDDKFHYDVSKLDQWQIVFDHAQAKGLYLHFKLQETENDDNVRGEGAGGRGKQPQTGAVGESLDGGALGPERKLYLREMIARFGHALALNWNLGEENTQSVEQQLAMSQYIHNFDPYRHHVVVHTHPGWQDAVYSKLLGDQSVRRVLLRLRASRERSRRRGFEEPRQELGFRAHRARLLSNAPDSILDDDQCRWTGRQHERRQQQVVFREGRRSLSRLPADRRHRDARFDRGIGVVHRCLVRSPEWWRAETRQCCLGESRWPGCARPGSR